ncbi:MAG TPA: nuclear transport factor 2 family protein [Acidimicrobiia bacterium]|jgi:hypothetical protein|nr:nuclear transport factor 2 family protein [Acidimicrobiia bacterium]
MEEPTGLGPGEVVERFWRAFSERDLDTAAGFLSDRFEQRWPQSGELIHGPANWKAMASSYPSLPESSTAAIYGEGSLWVAELVFDYGDASPPYQVAAIHRVANGVIESTVEFFGAPFEPADWRKDVVEVGPRPGE